MQLVGELIHLRALEPTDLNQLYRWENDSSIWSVSGTLVPFSKFVLEEFVTQVHQDIYTNKQLRLIVDLKYFDEADEDETTRSIGCVDLFDFDPKNKRAGVGILIADKADRGRGYATEALHLIVDYAFEVLDLHQIYSNVRVENESSVALFKKVGFEVTGLKQDWMYEQGKFYDEYTMQLIKK
ncbi:MAG: GNAT family N-acetyltransferase [Bacteroidia bacterium]|jgi:diamine N-acetyltransferase|nr:GNAT family N-acetyltransferase [Bacteroidota bacterium]MBP6335232.1 GNAT family N-acetyltransferase [Bacteroidia bacterium]MBK7429824.1 GNAT family N-acetyltransferase [Bacteroidota bacterium]MBP6532005.1 GNAT family N-acetyltransferase [Bacteroidia bacterium]MBP9789678.1 GNAT family N-acetyltransferase [Bacteroidia bacterium]